MLINSSPGLFFVKIHLNNRTYKYNNYVIKIHFIYKCIFSDGHINITITVYDIRKVVIIQDYYFRPKTARRYKKLYLIINFFDFDVVQKIIMEKNIH